MATGGDGEAAAGGGAVRLRGDWPFVARDEEVALLEAALDPAGDGSSRGAVVVAPAGVGKTRLARVAAERARARGADVSWAVGTRAARGTPYASLAHLAPAVSPGDFGDPVSFHSAFAAAFSAGGGERLLVVDDAHLLDEGGAALVLRLALSGAARVLVTARRGEPVPDAVTALWRDGLAERLDVQPFSDGEAERFLRAALGGEVAAPTLHRLAAVAGGNALHLREFVIAATGSGSLRPVDGVWRWDGRVPLPPRLVDAVGGRLDELPAERARALALVALGEPLGVDEVGALGVGEALGRLREAGLVRVGGDGECRLAHPLYGEVLLGRVGVAARRGMLGALADAADAVAGPAPGALAPGRGAATARAPAGEARLRAAHWRLEAGRPVAADDLVAASRSANARFDFAAAEALAAAALEREGGLAATVARARALGGLGRFAEAERILAAAEPGALACRAPEVRCEYLDRRVIVLHQGLGRHGEALAVLDRFERAGASGASARILAALRGVLLLDGGETGEALRVASTVVEDTDAEPYALVVAAEVAGEALVYRGETGRARAVLEGLRGVAEREPALAARVQSSAGLQEIMCLHLDGGLDASASMVEASYRRWVPGHDDVTLGLAAFALATTRLLQGRVRSARRMLREAADCLDGHDINGTLAWVWATAAQAEALLGDADAARLALERAESRALSESTGRSRLDFLLARAAVRAAGGDVSGAASLVLEGAGSLAEFPVHRARALHAALRFGAEPAAVAPVLEAATTGCPALVPGLYAAHARARASGDAGALEDVSARFEAAGMRLEAAEAAADAARRATSAGRAERARARSARLAAECEGARTPPLADDGAARALSRREGDVARLAAEGLSSPQIAERLVLSVRTVESHLYRAFAKLGVRRREELAEALGASRPADGSGNAVSGH